MQVLGLVNPWPGPLPVMFISPPLAMGATVEHMGRHKACLRSGLAPTGVHALHTRIGAQRLRMHTVRPTTCSSVDPMANAGVGDIPGNGPGQDNTSSSTYTHVKGAYGAPTGAVGAPPTAQFFVIVARTY